jgi:hypothetical protein
MDGCPANRIALAHVSPINQLPITSYGVAPYLRFNEATSRLEKLATGLERYKEIMALYKCSDNIAKDELFQRKFKSLLPHG